MEAENRWKTTEEEIPPNPHVETAENLIEILTKSVNNLKKEVEKLEQKLKEETNG
jgi:predicted RNase H-like nuclease (RuvC/YqgF family)